MNRMLVIGAGCLVVAAAGPAEAAEFTYEQPFALGPAETAFGLLLPKFSPAAHPGAPVVTRVQLLLTAELGADVVLFNETPTAANLRWHLGPAEIVASPAGSLGNSPVRGAVSIAATNRVNPDQNYTVTPAPKSPVTITSTVPASAWSNYLGTGTVAFDVDFIAPFTQLSVTPANLAGIFANNLVTGRLSVVYSTTATVPATFTNTLVPAGSQWRYRADGSDQGTDWVQPGFADQDWSTGGAPLGFGYGTESTLLPGGPPEDRFVTTYFRRTFAVTNAVTYTNLILRLQRDDGAAVYLNGQEIYRNNLRSGALDYQTRALSMVEGAAGHTLYSTFVDPTRLREGTNVIAVEVHQWSATDPDLIFELRLEGSGIPGWAGGVIPPVSGAPLVLRGTLQPDGQMAVSFEGQPGWRYLLEGTENLADWQSLGVLTATPGWSSFLVDASANGPTYRFFRVSLMP